jgi:biopolymer transport protein ExbB/TolQ
MRPELTLIPFVGLFTTVLPIIVGFAWIRPDANRSGQIGNLWALFTILAGWIAVLIYLFVRSARTLPPLDSLR